MLLRLIDTIYKEGELSEQLTKAINLVLESSKKTIRGKRISFLCGDAGTYHKHRRQILIGWQRNHNRRIPTTDVARIRSKSMEKRVLEVTIVLSLRRN